MSIKVPVLCYHKNAFKLYKPEWIDQYRDSILNQSYKEFDIWELNYGGTEERIFENSNFFSQEYPTFVHGLNFLLDIVFSRGYKCAANTNVDDTYSLRRLEVQMPYIEAGYDIVASNFCLVRDNKITHRHKFHELDLEEQLMNNHNIIGHSSVIYSSGFFNKNKYVPEEQPREDLLLWKRAISNSTFIIVQENLLYHRLHNQSVCQSQNR